MVPLKPIITSSFEFIVLLFFWSGLSRVCVANDCDRPPLKDEAFDRRESEGLGQRLRSLVGGRVLAFGL